MFPLFCLLLTFDDDDDGDNDNDHKGVDFIVGLNRFKTDGNFLDALLGNRCHVIRFSLKDVAIGLTLLSTSDRALRPRDLTRSSPWSTPCLLPLPTVDDRTPMEA